MPKLSIMLPNLDWDRLHELAVEERREMDQQTIVLLQEALTEQAMGTRRIRDLLAEHVDEVCSVVDEIGEYVQSLAVTVEALKDIVETAWSEEAPS